jgi:hypothetical protein
VGPTLLEDLGFQPTPLLGAGGRPSSRIRGPGIFPGDHVTQDDLRVVRRGHATVFPHSREKNSFIVAARNSFIGQLVTLVEKRMRGYPTSQGDGSMVHTHR